MNGYEDLIRLDWDLLTRIHDAVDDFRNQTGLRPNVIRLSPDLHQRWVIDGMGKDFEGYPVEIEHLSTPDSVYVLRETFEPWNLPTVPWDVPATATPLRDLLRKEEE